MSAGNITNTSTAYTIYICRDTVAALWTSSEDCMEKDICYQMVFQWEKNNKKLFINFTEKKCYAWLPWCVPGHMTP